MSGRLPRQAEQRVLLEILSSLQGVLDILVFFNVAGPLRRVFGLAEGPGLGELLLLLDVDLSLRVAFVVGV